MWEVEDQAVEGGTGSRSEEAAVAHLSAKNGGGRQVCVATW